MKPPFHMEEEEDFIIASKGNNPHMNKSTEQIKHKESDFAGTIICPKHMNL